MSLLILTMLGLLINARPETQVIADPEHRVAATFFSMLNAGALVLAILAGRDRGRPRVMERFRTTTRVICEGDDGVRIWASLRDVSVGGAGIDWPVGRPIPRTVTLHLTEGSTIRTEVVRTEGNELGLRFDMADSRERQSVLLWVYTIGLGTLRAPLSMMHLSR